MLNFERIELLGFKSFADKVKIDLLDGITAIVGPNGCGKSNVADAVKWVLGEQSAKTMRGTSMQDVIFNGTQARKSLSYCEVSLYFNNTEKLFSNLEYTQVVFTRKLYRSGESEYFINRQPCRMKDIVDALHECGVSKDGYTIIGQGKVSEILSSKPEDRRAIFEEAVGIAKTKRDRKESINKLARTNDNITRVSDILTERERQLEPLSRQAEKTRAFRSLSNDLKHHEINAYLYKFDHANETKTKIRERIKGLTEEIDVRKAELEETIKVYNAHQAEINSADEYIRSLNLEITEHAVGIEKQTGESKLYAEKISYFRSEIERIQNEIESGKEKLKEFENTLKFKREYGKKCNLEIDVLTKKGQEIASKINQITEEINRDEDIEQSIQSKVLKSVESLADINKNLGALSQEESVITQNQKAIVDKVNALVDRYTDVYSETEDIKLKLEETEKNIVKFNEDIKDKSIAVSETNEFISKIDNKAYAVKNRLASLETSLKFYLSLKDSFEGYNSSVKRLMLDAKNNAELSCKIKGVVATVITTDKEYETAIQTSIGGAMQNVITDNPTDAEYLINYLKKCDGGRVTFLPVTSVKARLNDATITSALKENGAIGLATDLVKYDSYYENIVAFLLGGTLIAKDLKCATEIAKKYKFAFKIVTLDGDILAQNGSMTGGSKKANDVNLLSIDRSVSEYQTAVNNDKNELIRLEQNKQNLLKQVNLEVTELDALKTSLVESKQSLVLLREKKNSNELTLENIQREIDKNKDEIAIIGARLEQIKTEFTDITIGNEKLNKEKEDASKEQSVRREKFIKLRQTRDEILKENTEVQAKLSYLRAEISASESDIERINGEIKGINENAVKGEQTIESDLKIINELKLQAEKVALTEDEQLKLKALRSKLQEFDEKKMKLNEMVVQDNLKRDVLQADINKSSQKREQEEVNFAKVDTELSFMSENIFNEYQLTYETCEEYRDPSYDVSMSHQDITTLKRKIASLGSINPNAIEEYNELSVAYNELLVQRDDLYKAQEDLQKVIDDLTKEMTLTFNEGFKTIKANFTKIFKELFGGGTADLIVEESETGDPLDAGIEIVAEPPGKKLQKISLLSGGEMALTAIAILFAILKLRPMPFCVLDEIEAALDDANVERFAKYLRNFSKETQFICITHKKVTMENADGLFGVTMPEKGVSSIVSVKLADIKDIEQS